MELASAEAQRANLLVDGNFSVYVSRLYTWKNPQYETLTSKSCTSVARMELEQERTRW